MCWRPAGSSRAVPARSCSTTPPSRTRIAGWPDRHRGSPNRHSKEIEMLFNPSRHRAVLGLVGVAALALTLVGCGGGKGSTPAGAAPSTAVDAALAAKVPAAIKSAGKIVIGTDSTYAPSEYLDTDGKTGGGFDVDLFNAVAGKLRL